MKKKVRRLKPRRPKPKPYARLLLELEAYINDKAGKIVTANMMAGLSAAAALRAVISVKDLEWPDPHRSKPSPPRRRKARR